jgi:hypothetical protein
MTTQITKAERTRAKRNLSATCIRRIRRMTAAIMAEPKFYDQNDFPQKDDCGMTCCAAGWAVWDQVTRKEYRRMACNPCTNWVRKAIEALRLPEQSYRVALGTLFSNAGRWPEPFSQRYYKAQSKGDHKGMARACRDRWEYFIKHDGQRTSAERT